ncbi:MAG: A/G-specific adenine glycosylase [Actinobacteria bacterium]|nr:A/G-specific adenine glycosylase [Actinomycetota bacterium]
MAQQTQVERVIPKWTAFLERWPDPETMAAASLGEVLELWQGLGYPRRAKALWEAAMHISARHSFPTDLADLLALPGVGGYTARAVQAFAYEFDVGVVDTNIARVLARRQGERLSARVAQDAADRFVPPGRGWAHNQSLMDLGSRLCRPEPACETCPLARTCAWHQGGHPDPDPAVGSAGVSVRQARFAGSDRQGRGRLLNALHNASVSDAELAVVMGWPEDPERAARVAATLVADGLARRSGSVFLRAD